jgi:solute carrier family 50 protein (sugar transporter)
VRSKSTEDFESAPYVLTLLNSLLWLYYSLTKPDGLLVATVNGFGAVMETIYVLLFLVYAADLSTRVSPARTWLTNKTYLYLYFLSMHVCLQREE